MSREKVTISLLKKMKEQNEKISMIVLYEFHMAAIAEKAGIDIILVGDSIGPTMLGYERMSSVTMEEMIPHCRAVARGADNAMVVGDLPFMADNVSIPDTIKNAGRLIKEGLCDAIKIEGGRTVAKYVKAITEAGIPVMGHIGLTPQTAAFDPRDIYGDDPESAESLMEDALALEEAGAFSVAVVCVPPELGEKISKRLSVPVIGLAAGVDCDGQSVTGYDALGISPGPCPPFLKEYVVLRDEIYKGISQYVKEVKGKKFPGKQHFLG